MKIAVCLKRAPDTATKIRIAPGAQDMGGRGIDPADVQYVISPYDEFAVEEALAIRERLGTGSVTVVCFGPEAAQQNLRQALAMGADDGIWIRNTEHELDPYLAARNLAQALSERADDLVLLGRQSVDGQSGQVGPLLARMLGRPCLADVVRLTIEHGRVRAEREVEGGRETLEAALPVVVTCQKGLNEPRYPSLKGIMAAKKKTITTVEPGRFEPRLRVVSLTLPPPRPAGRVLTGGVEDVPELVRLLREEAKVL